ncbi:MAG: TIGR03986 family CRISPR-associated RAMP protein [Gammaproteobacteria bacterium]|jgi:CRISPR-associated protein (TIGR03986 family)|nr:TIGR03986 family CRISPR-associated RAMP protein [Gammaproteobacteria bacterium]
MSKFLNPYQFIDAKEPNQGHLIDSEQVSKGSSQFVRHDQWVKDGRSGRIVCRLKIRTPTAVGGFYQKPKDNEPARQEPYRRNGRIAIPGSSLRGMIGSTLEAISASSLRILEDRAYSVRKSMTDSLKLIGRLQRAGGQWSITPLCVTALTINNKNAVSRFKTLDAVFRTDAGKRLPLADLLPAYIYPRRLEALGSLPSGARLKAQLSLTSDDHATLASLSNLIKKGRLDNRFHVKQRGGKTFLLGQRIRNFVGSLDQETQVGDLRRGWFRALGMTEDRALPKTKKYEYFIPEPESYAQSIPVSEDVVDKFLTLGKERHAENKVFPFQLQGQRTWDALQGALVYFDAEVAHGEPSVKEISLSSIWREQIPGSSHEGFKEIDPNLLPWSGQRTHLTPAEALMGVVQVDSKDEQKRLPALAGRVWVHDAYSMSESQVDESLLMEEIKLQILASPKPPSPSMYFHAQSDPQRPIRKSDLAAGWSEIVPRGRKIYIPHRGAGNEVVKAYASQAPEGDKSDNQRVRVRPIKHNEEFLFSIDFENLRSEELGLLLRAISPAGGFLHRLGVGKPLGMGSVSVAIEAVALWPRAIDDYSPCAFRDPPDCKWYSRDGRTGAPDSERVLEMLFGHRRTFSEESGPLSALVDDSLINQDILAQLSTAMNPENIKYPVCYPRTKQPLNEFNHSGQEADLFSWFVQNEKVGIDYQMLGPVEPGEPLPPLMAHPGPEDGSRA